MNKHAGRVIVENPETQQPKTFTFDHVFYMESTQEVVYEETVRNLVDSVLGGYNGTIFAYGQTGTGKTFSMEGVINDKTLCGVMPRAFEHIFSTINLANEEGGEFLVRASFIQIYLEKVYDLLSKQQGKILPVKENSEGATYVYGADVVVMKSREELQSLLEDGKMNRKVGATKMNRGSSRSHCIFSIIIEKSVIGPDGEPHVHVGKLNMVDLAGSERQKKTEASGDRLKEATKINLSLTKIELKLYFIIYIMIQSSMYIVVDC